MPLIREPDIPKTTRAIEATADVEWLANYIKPIVNELRVNFVRVEGDYSTNKINGKIQDVEQVRVHAMLVIGGRDMEAGAVSVHLHGKGQHGGYFTGDEGRRA